MRERSASACGTLASLAATLAVLIAASAHAQDAPDLAPPAFTPPGQTREHYVPQHVTRNGVFVEGHYEAEKKPPFQGYFADKQAQRQRQAQHGYKEPAPDYTSPPAGDDRRMEGR